MVGVVVALTDQHDRGQRSASNKVSRSTTCRARLDQTEPTRVIDVQARPP